MRYHVHVVRCVWITSATGGRVLVLLNATADVRRLSPARANALSAKNLTTLGIKVNIIAAQVERTWHAIIPRASVLRAVADILDHSVICLAAPLVCQNKVIRKMADVVHVPIKHRMVTSVSNHVVIHASTVNVNEMANVTKKTKF